MAFLCSAQQTVPSFSGSLVKRTAGPEAPGEHVFLAEAVHKDIQKPMYRLRGEVKIETSEMLLRADEADYNEDTGDLVARGNVFYHRFDSGEEIFASKVEYNVSDEVGKYYDVRGWSKPRIDTRPGMLSSTSPFYFEGKWAERIENKYILHEGFVTNCRMPKPWWILKGPKFLIIPEDHAIAYRTIFRLKGIPLFYAPAFYKSLEKEPRQSGFLTPNLGHSSIRGFIVGGGYYWAPRRNYDVSYRGDLFSSRGFAHQVGIRGQPTDKSEFNFYLFGANDKLGDGGFVIEATGKAQLGDGFQAVGDMDYLHSFLFRQTFTNSFNEAIYSESHSTGYVTRHWSSYDLNFVASRVENFQSTLPNDVVIIRKLPEVDFDSRDNQIWHGIPIWFSFESSAGLLRRDQLLFETRSFVPRLDFQPHLMTALNWKGFHLIPDFSVRETHWGEQMNTATNIVLDRGINRFTRQISIDLVPPSLSRTFKAPKWMGQSLKHVIEPRAEFLYTSGARDLTNLIRFDETELLSNTNQVELSLTNRIYVKRNDTVSELMTWEVFQQRYFDPTFGGAIVPGQRNVVLAAAELTPYTFLAGPRNYSPIISAFRISPVPGYGVEWRTDYDPLYHRFSNGSIHADASHGNFSVSVGQNFVNSVPTLTPNANQINGSIRFGNSQRRGWSMGFQANYDYRQDVMQYVAGQVTYNTDCCGFNVQYRRFAFGTRNENQFRVAFSVANVGFFGNMKKQEKLF